MMQVQKQMMRLVWAFSAIYEAMTSTSYINQSSLTSIFSLIDEIKDLNSGATTAIDALVTAQSTSILLGIDTITDKYGTGETHSGYNTGPFKGPTSVYSTVTDDGVATEVCSHSTAQKYNGLGTRAFLRLIIASAGRHLIQVTYSRGAIATGDSNPDFKIYLDGIIKKIS